jgi:choline dehydrogenase-like flavoprotein
VASTSGLSGSGYVAILTNSNGYQVVNYSGTTPTSLTGCSGGTGAFNNGAGVFKGPFDGGLLVQASFSNAALTVPGGAPCPLVLDYNCNTSFVDGQTQLNCVSQNQNFLTNVFTRTGAQTAYLNSSIALSDGNGNFVGVSGRKLIVLTNCKVLNAIKDFNKSTNSYVASGVQFMQENITKSVVCKNIVGAMGAGYSPRFWQLSGLGPSTVLSNLGIKQQATSPGLEQIGKNLHTQYGPLLGVVTTNPYFLGIQFPGQSFVQYNGNPRSFQSICFSSANLNVGLLGGVPPIQPLPPAPQVAYFEFDGFACHNRSRGGYSNTISSTFEPQLDFNWGFFTDAPNVNFTGTISGTTLTVSVAGSFPLIVGQTITGTGIVPGTMIVAQLTGPAQPTPGVAATYVAGPGTYTLSVTYDGMGSNPPPIATPTAMTLNKILVTAGLSDPDSDISVFSAFLDYQYNVLLNMRTLDPGHTYNYTLPPNIETVMAVPGMERWRQYSYIVPYFISNSAHESGTMVMNNDPTKGAVDGNTRLHGTLNCFQADFSIFPVQNDGNPSLMIMPVATLAAQQISSVALN